MTKRVAPPREHGHPDLGMSRHAVLWIALAGWGALGLFLLGEAYWPSTCTPAGLIDLYRCSVRLPEKHGWAEAALLTWLWATPLLVGLDLWRRVRRWLDR